MNDKSRLVSDNPDPKKKAWAKESPEDPEQCVRHECNGSLWIKADQCPFYHKFEVIPGNEVLVCVHCLAEGKVSKFP